MIAKAVNVPTTFAELHQQLGEVPLERIRMKPPPGTATEEDVLKAGKPVCELIDGVLVEKAVGTEESIIAWALSMQLGQYVVANDLGVLAVGDGSLRLGAGSIRVPDLSFLPWELLPADRSTEAIWTITPPLIVEVLSRTNTKAEMDRKLRELFGAGCKLAWVIDPRTQSADIYTSAAKFKTIDATGTLDGGRVLPGFKLPLADLFAATKRRKGKPK